MPILKVRQTDNAWYKIDELTLNKLYLGNDIVLSSETNGGNKLFVVNGEKILDQGDYNTLNGLIGTNTTNIGAIKEKLAELTKFCEIDSDDDGKLDLSGDLGKYTKIHAFINFKKTPKEIKYGSSTNIIKGDNPIELEKAGIYELDAYKYGEKFYIIWKNWGE